MDVYNAFWIVSLLAYGLAFMSSTLASLAAREITIWSVPMHATTLRTKDFMDTEANRYSDDSSISLRLGADRE